MAGIMAQHTVVLNRSPKGGIGIVFYRSQPNKSVRTCLSRVIQRSPATSHSNVACFRIVQSLELRGVELFSDSTATTCFFPVASRTSTSTSGPFRIKELLPDGVALQVVEQSKAHSQDIRNKPPIRAVTYHILSCISQTLPQCMRQKPKTHTSLNQLGLLKLGAVKVTYKIS